MTTRLGMIARADDGGLGTISHEFARHLKPQAALIVQLGRNERGASDLSRISDHVEECQPTINPIPYKHADWLASRCDVVYSAETFYGPDLVKACRKRNVQLVLHAMPELYRDEGEDVLWVPTTWKQHRFQHETRLVPVPVARDRLPFRLRTEARRFMRVSAPAMCDRDGADLIREAEQFTDIRVIPRPHSVNYWDGYDQADVLVLPRRYGGLSLPAQEAASCGMPVVCLGLEPLVSLPFTHVMPCHPTQKVRMRGGSFGIHACDPGQLAAELDWLVRTPADVRILSQRADSWADENSWETLLPLYRQELGLEES